MKPIAFLALLSLASVLTAGDTLHVPRDFAKIQDAIASADDGDTVLVAPGRYVEQIDFLGKAVKVVSEAGAAATVINSHGLTQWPDYPTAAVVRMVNGEGSATTLEGFTVTGGQTFGSRGGSAVGIYCAGLAPTIRDCVITGNQSGMAGGGVHGNPLLERCTISHNESAENGQPGGGAYGAPTVIDCVIFGNRSGDRGGGIFVTGPCTITGTVIDSNIGGNGNDGYTGGGVFGPGTLIDCQVTRNTAHHYFSPEFDEIGTGVDGAILLKGCTVADNIIAGDTLPGDQSGGVRNVTAIEDSILWGNEGHDISLGSSPTVRYSTVGGGYPGVGNLALSPQFLDPGSGDYFLQPSSTAIDAGDPASDPDPDGTRADMGAFYFPQFQAMLEPQNGTGLNPPCFTSVLQPVLGTTWVGSVDSTAHGFAASAVVLIGYSAPLAPISLAVGELLVDPNSLLILLETVAPIGGLGVFTVPIPANYAFGGTTVYTQAVVVGDSIGLCNGLDVTLGL